MLRDVVDVRSKNDEPLSIEDPETRKRIAFYIAVLEFVQPSFLAHHPTVWLECQLDIDLGPRCLNFAHPFSAGRDDGNIAVEVGLLRSYQEISNAHLCASFPHKHDLQILAVLLPNHCRFELQLVTLTMLPGSG